MPLHLVPPSSATIALPAGIAPLISGKCATLAQTAYGAVTADAFFDVTRCLDPDEHYFFAQDQWIPPSANAGLVRAAADRFSVAREPLVLTWAASMRERFGSPIVGIRPQMRALRLCETASVILYNQPAAELASFAEVGAREFRRGASSAATERKWHMLLSLASYTRAALFLSPVRAAAARADYLNSMIESALQFANELDRGDLRALEVVRELCRAVASPEERTPNAVPVERPLDK